MGERAVYPGRPAPERRPWMTPATPPDPALAPPLRGREAATDAVASLVRALRDGRGGVLLVEGVAGSGRTRVLQEAVARARAAGVRTVVAAGDGDALLAALADDAEPPPPGTAGDPLRLLQELERGLTRAARERPLLVVVDDAGRADPATLHALRTVPPRLGDHAVAWILAVDAGAAGGGLGGPGAAVLRLAPLDRDAAALLATDLLGAAPDDGLRAGLDAACGLPLLLHALLAGWREEDALDVRDGVATRLGERPPARFGDALAARAAALSPAAAELVRWAALTSDRVSLDLLAALLGTTPGSLLAPLREALLAGLLVEAGAELGFPHALSRVAIAERVGDEDRTAARAAALALVERADAAPAAVGALLAATARPGDTAAIAVLRRAAAALRGAEPTAAANLAARALQLAPEQAPGRGAILDEAVDLLAEAGQASGARALVRQALERGLRPAEEARARLALTRLSGVHAFAEGASEIERAIGIPGLPAGLEAQLLATRSLSLSMLGETSRARRAATAALAAGRAVPDGAAEAIALFAASVEAFHRLAWDEALERAEEAVAAVRRDGAVAVALWVPGACWRVLLWSACGRTAAALAEADASLEVARGHGGAAAIQLWTATRSRLLLDAGRLPAVGPAAEAAFALARPLGRSDFTDATAGYAAARAALLTGEGGGAGGTDPARAQAERMRADPAAAIRRPGAWLAALLADRDGDRAAVAAHLSDELALSTPFDAADLPAFVGVALRAGLRERAEAAVRVAGRRAAQAPGHTVLDASARHARGLLDGEAELLAGAARAWDAAGRPLPAAAACEDLGGALAAADRPRAIDALADAGARYAAAGAAHEAERVRARLAALGAGPRHASAAPPAAGPAPAPPRTGWDALTAAELRVVELVAEGGTNRAVAERLGLSANTVATHLRHAFAKLGVASRVELARLAAARDARDARAG